MDCLEALEVVIADIDVPPAIQSRRGDRRSRRARREPRATAAPAIQKRPAAEQPHDEIDQQADNQNLQQGAEHSGGVAFGARRVA